MTATPMIQEAQQYPSEELKVGDYVFSNIGRPVKITKIEGKEITLDGSLMTRFGKTTFAYKSDT